SASKTSLIGPGENSTLSGSTPSERESSPTSQRRLLYGIMQRWRMYVIVFIDRSKTASSMRLYGAGVRYMYRKEWDCRMWLKTKMLLALSQSKYPMVGEGHELVRKREGKIMVYGTLVRYLLFMVIKAVTPVTC